MEREAADLAQRRRELEREVFVARRNNQEGNVLARLSEVLQPPARGAPRTFGRREVRRPTDGTDESDVLFEQITFEQPIGAGSFGAVYKGQCKGKVVAIKKCRVDDRKDADMLIREIRYLQQLLHPRLVAFIGCCNRPPHVVMLLEFMEGGSLHSLLFAKGKTSANLSLARKARMAQEVAEGLTYLHDISVVHRDLKTMNIVMDKQLSCKICDFGLTFTLENTHMTVRSLQGSPRYMAPEQFEVNARITEKVDIWQFGCVLLELFCLRVPFSDAKGVQQVAGELLIRKRPPATPPDADPRARVLIQACLRLEGKQRPPADAVERALGLLVQALPLEERAPPTDA